MSSYSIFSTVLSQVSEEKIKTNNETRAVKELSGYLKKQNSSALWTLFSVLQRWKIRAVDDHLHKEAVFLNVGVLLILLRSQHAERHEQRAVRCDVHLVIWRTVIPVVEKKGDFLFEWPAQKSVIWRTHDYHK